MNGTEAHANDSTRRRAAAATGREDENVSPNRYL